VLQSDQEDVRDRRTVEVHTEVYLKAELSFIGLGEYRLSEHSKGAFRSASDRRDMLQSDQEDTGGRSTVERSTDIYNTAGMCFSQTRGTLVIGAKL
jgi:hypothetical protein